MTDDESEHLVSAGRKLVVARKAAKLTQEQLAKELRLSSRAIRSLEKGERKARHETQAKIHRVLGIDLYGTLDEFYDEILGTGSDPRERPSSPPERPANPPSPREGAEAFKPIPERVSKSEHPANCRPSPNNPFVVMCRECGENEYVSRPFCRCSAPLTDQVQDQFSDWVAVEDTRVANRVRWMGRTSAKLLIAVFLLFAAYIAAASWWRTSQHVLEKFEIFYFPVLLGLVGLLATYAELERRKERLEKYKRNLSFDDFLRSAHFRTLRRPE